MACTPQIRFGAPPAGSCISQELVDYLNQHTEVVSACNPTNTTGIFTGPNPPGVDDTDVYWMKTDVSGNKLYLLGYTNGRWRRIGGCPIGLKAYFNGNYSANFDITTGKGIMGGEWDGWETKFSDANKFVVEAESYNGSAWLSSVTGAPLNTGGVASVTSDNANTYRPARAAVTVAQGYADGNNNTGTPAGVVYTTAGGAPIVTLLTADAGNTSPTPMSNIPPFVSYVLVEYVGTAT